MDRSARVVDLGRIKGTFDVFAEATRPSGRGSLS
jgi:hypothetical protein